MPSIIKRNKHELPSEIKPSLSSCIFFDIETSGLAMTSEILEIAATHKEKTFDIYITPQKPIDVGASSVNKITMVNNVLHYKNMPVKSVPIGTGLQNFLTYIQGIPEPRIILGHNIKRFDCRFITSALSEVGLLPIFTKEVAGFIDTLPLFKEIRPDLPDFKQGTIVKSLLNLNYEEHNALADAISLQKVFYSSQISDNVLRKYSFTHSLFSKENLQSQNYNTLLWMKNNPKFNLPLTKFMIDKIAKAGLSYNELKIAYTKDGKEGLQQLLQGSIKEKPNVTKDKKVIESLFQFFARQKKFFG